MRIAFLLLLCSFFQPLFGQYGITEKNNRGDFIGVNIIYAAHSPGGDLSDRFGLFFDVGLGLDYMVNNSNIIFGVDGRFFFGSRVKEDLFSTIEPDGQFIGNSRIIADVQLRQRGFYMGAYIGKLFSVLPNNKRSGIRATVGVGLLQHRIRIQQDPDSFVAQVAGEYAKGYDRLSNGLALQEFIGYQHLSKNRLINVFAGLEMYQAFTQNRRSFNFDERRKDDMARLDLSFGFKVGITLPFYFSENPDEIYY
ncbi:MAG: hypothetical protein AAF985_21890 [Bacteroidota bacterium]